MNLAYKGESGIQGQASKGKGAAQTECLMIVYVFPSSFTKYPSALHSGMYAPRTHIVLTTLFQRSNQPAHPVANAPAPSPLFVCCEHQASTRVSPTPPTHVR